MSRGVRTARGCGVFYVVALLPLVDKQRQGEITVKIATNSRQLPWQRVQRRGSAAAGSAATSANVSVFNGLRVCAQIADHVAFLQFADTDVPRTACKQVAADFLQLLVVGETRLRLCPGGAGGVIGGAASRLAIGVLRGFSRLLMTPLNA